MNLLTIILLLFLHCNEPEPAKVESWEIGRFVVLKDSSGYFAMTGEQISGYYDTAYKAINSFD